MSFHIYKVGANAKARSKVKLFWENENLYEGAGIEGMKRLNNIIGMSNHPGEKYYDKEEDEYGLGHVRTTAKFYELYGIHTQNKTVENHLCRFVGKPMQKLFIPALRENRMGLDLDKIDFKWKDPNPGEDYDYEASQEEEKERSESRSGTEDQSQDEDGEEEVDDGTEANGVEEEYEDDGQEDYDYESEEEQEI